jgi:hypothetical protein
MTQVQHSLSSNHSLFSWYSNFFRTAGGETHTGGFLRSRDNAWPEFHGHTIFNGTDGKSKIISQVDSGPGERLISKELEN